MVEIGKNLQYERFLLEDLTDSLLTLKDGAQNLHRIDVPQIKEIELVGVVSNSGFCGSMEWGMGNPTFLLPTNLFYNIFNVFKRRNDPVHIKIVMRNGREFIVIGKENHYIKLGKLLKR